MRAVSNAGKYASHRHRHAAGVAWKVDKKQVGKHARKSALHPTVRTCGFSMLLSAIECRGKARGTFSSLNTSSGASNTNGPPSAKKQRSIQDFFPQQALKSSRKKRPAPSSSRLSFTEEGGLVKKRIDYDTSDSEAANDNSCESNEEDQATSQNSEMSDTLPQPKRIDFSMCSSQKSEPDGEPGETEAQSLPPRENPLFSKSASQVSFADGTTFSTSSFNRMFSQDDFDFCTPQDQPVMHLSHPTTPSPIKKRHRRLNEGQQHAREVEVQNLTQDMTHMDVRARLGPPSLSSTPSESGPSPSNNSIKAPTEKNDQMHHIAVSAKKKPRLSTGSIPPSAPSRVWQNFVNPFVPSSPAESRKKKGGRSRNALPPSFANELGSSSLSKYLTDFVELELIGSGSFSKVFKCMKRIDGWTYAIKKSKRHFRGRADTERALREVHALAALSHSNHVVRYFDAWMENDLLYIQLEYCSGCSLSTIVDRYKPHHVPEDVLCRMLCHLAKGLHDMHTRKIVHMDVKLQNVLVGPGEVYKLGDLGTAAPMDGTSEITEGDNRYLSRELLEGSRANLRAGDIFALGATIYELALGSSLPSNGEEWQKIRDGDLVLFRHYSNSLQHLIASMLHPDPLQRPSAGEILQHEVISPFK